MRTNLLGAVGRELEQLTGIHVDIARARPVAGGSINRAFKLPGDTGPLFVKINAASTLSAFEAEAEGLAALRDAGGVAVPGVLGAGRTGGAAYLALEWIDLGSRAKAAERRLGRGLAQQHRATAEQFGWHRHNTIGATPQRNTQAEDWLDFFGRERLGFQLDLAREHGLPQQQIAQGRELAARLEPFFDDYRPEASLLHGDLWSGNWGADAAGTPYIFDPAVYYGDREADLAMTRLFGGFGPAFHAAYQEAWPLARGWERRVDLYNLYHLLNHFNLFGASYLSGIADSLARLLGERHR